MGKKNGAVKQSFKKGKEKSWLIIEYEEPMVYIHHEILFNFKKKPYYVICYVDGSRECEVH